MLEQEIASIMQYILNKAGNPPPYYHEVPEDFLIPSIYFPTPEVLSNGDTFSTYVLNYSWYIKFFHVGRPEAYNLAFPVLTAIRGARNIIPLINIEGKPTGESFHINDPELKNLAAAPEVAQLTITWDSSRPYDDPVEPQMMDYDLDMYIKSSYEQAIDQLGGTS